MKNLKKLFAVLAAIMMVLTLGTTAVKAEGDERTITISTKEGQGDHDYKAYQIFTGTYKDGKLTAPEFGENVDSDKLIEEVNKVIVEANKLIEKDEDKIEALAADASAPAVAEAIGKMNASKDSDIAKALAKGIAKAVKGNPAEGTNSVKVKGDGFYFVEDVTAELDENDAYSRYIMLNVSKDVTVEIKADVVKSDKKVKEKNDTTGKESEDWQDAADYDIGDKVPFRLTATLPENYAEFKKYSMWFCDEQSAGLTFNNDDVKVYIDGQLLDASKYSIEENVKVNEGTDDEKTLTFVVKIPELVGTNAKKGSVVSVEYTSTLNTNAKLGVEGNPNKSYVKYSNNPNDDQGGEPEGTTPEDKVVVFTYQIVANKVGDDETTKLEGAGFTLYKKTAGYTENDGWKAVRDEITGETTFTFKGTDAGEYKLVETTVPRGYNKAEDILFTVTATYETESDDPQLTDLKVTPENAGFTVSTDFSTATTKVINRSGATLPETGGIGTTIFYTVGGLLVVGAIIMLIQKRRMAE